MIYNILLQNQDHRCKKNLQKNTKRRFWRKENINHQKQPSCLPNPKTGGPGMGHDPAHRCSLATRTGMAPVHDPLDPSSYSLNRGMGLSQSQCWRCQLIWVYSHLTLSFLLAFGFGKSLFVFWGCHRRVSSWLGLKWNIIFLHFFRKRKIFFMSVFDQKKDFFNSAVILHGF